MLENFYDQLVPYYKLIYPDWEASVKRQADQLDGLIRETVQGSAHTILDAACGIGTQSLGLAALGYAVTATDISPGELSLAQSEADRRGAAIEFAQADMRQVWAKFGRSFDAVIACDNALPHLLSDADILQALEAFFRCTRPGGCCLVSVRDYSQLERSGRRIYPRPVHATPDGYTLLFDLWAFEGDFYEMTTYIVEDRGQPVAQTRVIRGGKYYCVPLERLEQLMRQAGFSPVEVLRERFFQPMLVGVRPIAG